MQPIKRVYPKLLIMDDIVEREMKWLWYPYIPMGSASMIFGPGGYGKSHITCEITACLTTGRPLPGQTDHYPPRKVLMLSAEDEYDAVLRPRLRRAGADLTKVAVPEGSFTLDKYGIRQMEEYMREFSATVVFIDPMVHYIGSKVDMNRMNEVREVTGGLHRAAINSESAVIIVHHSRKGTEGQDFEKASGSADFNNAVRSVLYTTRTNDGTRVLRHVKSNYSKLGPTLGYDFGETGVEWDEEAYADEDLEAPRGHKASMIKFIKDILKDGPVASSEIERAAGEADLVYRTLNRIKKDIAESYAKRVDNILVWYWRLLGDKRPPQHGDLLNVNATVSSLEERPAPRHNGRGPDPQSDRPMDTGEGEGVDAEGPIVATARQSRAGGSRARALPGTLGVGSKFKGEVARELALKGRLS